MKVYTIRNGRPTRARAVRDPYLDELRELREILAELRAQREDEIWTEANAGTCQGKTYETRTPKPEYL